MKYKGVIFDLDGTLLDTLEDLADSFNYALNENRFPVHPINAYRYFIGNGARKAVERALPEGERNNTTVEIVLATFNSWYNDHYRVKTKAYEGVNEILSKLNQMEIKLAVLSNKPHDFTIKCVQHYFPETFDHVQGHKTGFLRKPDPNSTQGILDNLGVAKHDVVFVGDTRTDMETAKNSKLISVGAAWGFRGQEELNAAGADYIIDHPQELLTI